LITYIQWLGSWLDSYPYYEDYDQSPVAKIEAAAAKAAAKTADNGDSPKAEASTEAE